MESKAELAQVEEIIRQRGPQDIARVAPSDVVTAEWVRIKCQFGCGGYGRSLTCPPYSPTPEQTRRMLDEYRTAYVIWWGHKATPREASAEIEREVFLLGFYRAFAMAGGPCHLCEPCPVEHPCRRAYVSRPAMEACGIDVYETARRAGFPLSVATCREDPVNLYGMLLVE